MAIPVKLLIWASIILETAFTFHSTRTFIPNGQSHFGSHSVQNHPTSANLRYVPQAVGRRSQKISAIRLRAQLEQRETGALDAAQVFDEAGDHSMTSSTSQIHGHDGQSITASTGQAQDDDGGRSMTASILRSMGLHPVPEGGKFGNIVQENEARTLQIENFESDSKQNLPANRSLLLWLPGIDGLALSASPQFESLNRVFEIRILTFKGTDRTDFDGVVDFCVNFLESSLPATPGGVRQGAIIGGESFGGLLALGIALKNPTLIQGLVLVNPATSYATTFLPALAPSINQIERIVPMSDAKLSDLIPALPFKLEKNLGELAYLAIGTPLLVTSALTNDQRSRLASALFDRLLNVARNASSGIMNGQLPPEMVALGEVDSQPKSSHDLSPTVAKTSSVSSHLFDKAFGCWSCDLLRDAIESIDSILAILSAETLSHRLQNLLGRGVAVVNPRLGDIKAPVLVLAGAEDGLLPSKDEAGRLESAVPVCTVLRVPRAGHVMLDARVNLTALILDSPVAPRRLRRDPVLDFVPPSAEAVKNATRRLELLRRLSSPLFYSTAPGGRVVRGLGALPPRPAPGPDGRRRPMLFVGNHQLLAADLALLVGHVLEETGILMRGLAHPALFSIAGDGGSSLPGMLPREEADGNAAAREGAAGGGDGENLFKVFGAVPVSPITAHKLMSSGDVTLLFPGGAREALHGPGEAYRLFWPDRPDFVRLAARYDAIIVPFGSIGAADSLRYLPNMEDTILSVLGAFFGGDNSNGGRGGGGGGGGRQGGQGKEDRLSRWGTPGLNQERLALPLPPLMVPRPPWESSRFYYLFGEPIDAAAVDPEDAAACARMYAEARERVERCIRTLLAGRARDPYADGGRRLLYEAVNGKQAPGFDP